MHGKSSGWHKRFTSSVEDVAGWTAAASKSLRGRGRDYGSLATRASSFLVYCDCSQRTLYHKGQQFLSFSSMLLFDVKKRIEKSQSYNVICWILGLKKNKFLENFRPLICLNLGNKIFELMTVNEIYLNVMLKTENMTFCLKIISFMLKDRDLLKATRSQCIITTRKLCQMLSF